MLVNRKIFLTCIILCLNIFNIFSQWTQIVPATYADLLDVFFINQQTGYIVGDIGKILKTTNEGVSWSISNLEFYYLNKKVYFINTSTGYISASKELVEPFSHYLYRTTNSGLNWEVTYDAGVYDITGINFSNGFTGFFGITRCDSFNVSKIFRGPPLGPWTQVLSDSQCGVYTIKFKSNVGYASGYTNGKIFKTTNYGTSWQSINIGYPDAVNDIHVFSNDTCIIAGNNGKIFRTVNGGINWNPINSGTSLNLIKISFPDSLTGYIGSDSYNYLKSTDGGNTWFIQSTGFAAVLRSIFFINSMTGYGVGYNGFIIKTTNGGAIGIKSISNSIPENFGLFQNYPNPFNPLTTIKIEIPKSAFVRLIIYNALGMEVGMLINENLHPGIYEIEWNASEYASGVYYYKLKTDVYFETKKMILIK